MPPVEPLEQPTETVARLNAALDESAGPAFAGKQRVALLDYPLHRNAGDSAIWVGERAWFRRRGLDVIDVTTRSTYTPRRIRRLLGRDGVLALHGGGNFGDVWPRFHALREWAADDFPDHRIVQLPQTVHFGQPVNRQRASAGPLGRHRDLTILCRDHRSLDVIRETFPGAAARLSPDMAFAIGSQRRGAPRSPVLWLARDDHERSATPPPSDARITVTDWRLDRSSARRWRFGALVPRHAHRVSAVPVVHEAVAAAVRPLLDPLAVMNVRGACDVLSEGQVVVTDRLHAHIICVLLSIPHVVLDNDYGKLSTFMAAWTAGTAQVGAASDAREARTQAESLLRVTPSAAENPDRATGRSA